MNNIKRVSLGCAIVLTTLAAGCLDGTAGDLVPDSADEMVDESANQPRPQARAPRIPTGESRLPTGNDLEFAGSTREDTDELSDDGHERAASPAQRPGDCALEQLDRTAPEEDSWRRDRDSRLQDDCPVDLSDLAGTKLEPGSKLDPAPNAPPVKPDSL